MAKNFQKLIKDTKPSSQKVQRFLLKENHKLHLISIKISAGIFAEILF
jgi:hypothetical protein